MVPLEISFSLEKRVTAGCWVSSRHCLIYSTTFVYPGFPQPVPVAFFCHVDSFRTPLLQKFFWEVFFDASHSRPQLEEIKVLAPGEPLDSKEIEVAMSLPLPRSVLALINLDNSSLCHFPLSLFPISSTVFAHKSVMLCGVVPFEEVGAGDQTLSKQIHLTNSSGSPMNLLIWKPLESFLASYSSVMSSCRHHSIPLLMPSSSPPSSSSTPPFSSSSSSSSPLSRHFLFAQLYFFHQDHEITSSSSLVELSKLDPIFLRLPLLCPFDPNWTLDTLATCVKKVWNSCPATSFLSQYDLVFVQPPRRLIRCPSSQELGATPSLVSPTSQLTIRQVLLSDCTCLSSCPSSSSSCPCDHHLFVRPIKRVKA